MAAGTAAAGDDAPEAAGPPPSPLPAPSSGQPGGAEAARFDFGDRGDSSLSESAIYKYSASGLTCSLSGWTHTRGYAKGFLRNTAGSATAVVTGLKPGATYSYSVFQYASESEGTNPLSVNGAAKDPTTSSTSELPTSEGVATAYKVIQRPTEGAITFTFTSTAHSTHVHLSAIVVCPEGADGGVED